MMQATITSQPPRAAAGGHGRRAPPCVRRRNSDAATKPPANGSHARARNEKNAEPDASLLLCQRHHTREMNAINANAAVTRPGPLPEGEARRQTKAVTRGIQI